MASSAVHSGWTPSSSSPSTGPSQAVSQSRGDGHAGEGGAVPDPAVAVAAGEPSGKAAAPRVSHGLFSSDDESEEETPVRVRQPLRLLWNRVNAGVNASGNGGGGSVNGGTMMKGGTAPGGAGRLHAVRSPVKRFAAPSPLGGASTVSGDNGGGGGSGGIYRHSVRRGPALPCPMLHAPSPSQVACGRLRGGVVGRLLARQSGAWGGTTPSVCPLHTKVVRTLPMRALVQSAPGAARCIFLGFTKNGRHLVSYSFDDHPRYFLQLWRLCITAPGRLSLECELPLFTHANLRAELGTRLAFGGGEVMRLTVWQSSDERLLVVTAVEAQVTSRLPRNHHVSVVPNPVVSIHPPTQDAELTSVHFTYLVSPPFPRPSPVSLVHLPMPPAPPSLLAPPSSCHYYALVLNTGTSLRVLTLQLVSAGVSLLSAGEDDDGPSIAQRTFSKAPQWCVDSSHKLSATAVSHRTLVRCRVTPVPGLRATSHDVAEAADVDEAADACMPRSLAAGARWEATVDTGRILLGALRGEVLESDVRLVDATPHRGTLGAAVLLLCFVVEQRMQGSAGGPGPGSTPSAGPGTAPARRRYGAPQAAALPSAPPPPLSINIWEGSGSATRVSLPLSRSGSAGSTAGQQVPGLPGGRYRTKLVVALSCTTGELVITSMQPLPYSDTRLSVHTSALITDLRRVALAGRDVSCGTREWTNDALLSGTSLSALRHPTLPLAIVL